MKEDIRFSAFVRTFVGLILLGVGFAYLTPDLAGIVHSIFATALLSAGAITILNCLIDLLIVSQ